VPGATCGSAVLAEEAPTAQDVQQQLLPSIQKSFEDGVSSSSSEPNRRTSTPTLARPMVSEIKGTKKYKGVQVRLVDLRYQLRQPNVDWGVVRTLLFVDDLDPNHTDYATGMSTVHRAAFDGEADIIAACIEAGCDLNAQTHLGRTAFHYACNGNKTGCIRLLLDHGADANCRTLSHQTPLHLCCSYGHLEATVELIDGCIKHAQHLEICAEDTNMVCPEKLTHNKAILRAIHKYRLRLKESEIVTPVSPKLAR